MNEEQIILILEIACTALEGHDKLRLLPLLRPAINKLDEYITTKYDSDVELGRVSCEAVDAFHTNFHAEYPLNCYRF